MAKLQKSVHSQVLYSTEPGTLPYKWPIFFAAVLTPMLFWALLALSARKRPGVLPALYPWLKGLCMVLWIASMLLVAIWLGSNSKKLMLLWSSVFVFYGGLNLIQGWVKRRVDPEPSSNGWWPSPKRF